MIIKVIWKFRHLVGGFVLLDYVLAKGWNIHIAWLFLGLILFEIMQVLYFHLKTTGYFWHNIQLYFRRKGKILDTFMDIFLGLLGIIMRGFFG